MPSYLTVLVRQQKERDIAYEREQKKHTTWGVYPHAQWINGEIQKTGQGYVAREMRDGEGLGVPYNRMKPVKVFKSQSLADKYSSKLTFG